MASLEVIADALAAPMTVNQSVSDDAVWLYYCYCVGTRVGDKFMCVVVKEARVWPAES